MAEVLHKQGQGRTFFVLTEDGKTIGTLAYTRPVNDNVLVIQHTAVDEGHEGKGYGKMLIDAAANFARENNLRINPMCSYAKSVMRKTDQYTDILI